jgi:hypothetical protein
MNVSDSDKELTPLTVVEERTLWIVQLKTDDGDWIDYGTHTKEWKDILRTYDYRKEHFPDEPIRVVCTEVSSRVGDPEWLRLRLKEEESGPAK